MNVLQASLNIGGSSDRISFHGKSGTFILYRINLKKVIYIPFYVETRKTGTVSHKGLVISLKEALGYLFRIIHQLKNWCLAGVFQSETGL